MQEWYELAKEIYDFHKERQSTEGVARKGVGSTGWGVRDTAKEFRSSIGHISENIKLGEALENNVVNVGMTRTKALEILDLRRIQFSLFGLKYIGKNEIYKREDNKVPYLFNSKELAKSMCESLKGQGAFEPCRVEFKVTKSECE